MSQWRDAAVHVKFCSQFSSYSLKPGAQPRWQRTQVTRHFEIQWLLKPSQFINESKVLKEYASNGRPGQQRLLVEPLTDLRTESRSEH
jgi:hypothetical protein